MVFPPILLFLHCIFIFLFKKWLGPIGTFYGSLLIITISILLLINEFFLILINGNYYFIDFGRWFFCLDLIDSHLIFCIDSLAAVTALLVLLLTALALYFGVEYMFRDAFINRLLYLLNLFATSVVFLFFCFDYFLILFAWESIGLFSLLLVNFYSMRIYTLKAALKTFIFSRISDMFMFVSFIFVVSIFNTTDLSLIFLQIPFLAFHYIFIGGAAFHFLTIFAFCITMSGVIKAAQFFFHVWLPDAMEAPTPASALIHSSTLVVAGVFLIIRFSILFEFAILVNYFLALLGGTTLAFGAVTATFQHDIKKLVAYSTISQIGYLVCGCGFCCYEEVLLYLIIHALNKAFLFILVGYIVHFFNGNTDMRQMGGAYIYSFDIAVLLFGVCFNLAGLPYSAGFFGKEFLLFQVLRDDFLSFFVRACWLLGFFFTPIYMFMIPFLVLFNVKKSHLSTYAIFWSFSSSIISKISLNFIHTFWKSAPAYLNFNSIARFQFTALTSRATIYTLFIFWLFFFSFGESLLLFLLNFSTLSDLIPSSFFFTFKNHQCFSLAAFSIFLSQSINFYILFFTIAAFYYLISLRYDVNYHCLELPLFFEFLILCAIASLFSLYTLFAILIVLVFTRNY